MAKENNVNSGYLLELIKLLPGGFGDLLFMPMVPDSDPRLGCCLICSIMVDPVMDPRLGPTDFP